MRWVGARGSQRRVLVRNGAWETASFAIAAAVMFFLSPFIVHRLGNSLYGIWEMIIALTGFLSFADLGVRPAAVHFIARNDAQEDHDAVNRFVNTAFLTFSAAALLILVLAGPLSFLLPRFWNVAEGFETEASIALLLVALEIALSLPLNAFSAVLVGKQRYDLLGTVRLVGLAVRATAIVVVLTQGLGLVALALVVAVTGLLEMSAYTVVAFRIEPTLRFSPRLASRDSALRLLKYGGWATLVIVALQVIWATDALVIGRALTAVAVTYFAVGFKLAFYAREFLRVGVRVLEPAMSRLYGLGDREGILRLLVASVRTILVLAGPILVYLLVVGRPFLGRWMGAEYAERCFGVLWIMTFAVLPAVGAAPLATVYYGTNRARPLALLMCLEAGLNLGLSIALVGPLGIEGVAIGTAIPALLVQGILLPVVLCRHFGISAGTFLARTWGGPVLAGGLSYLLLAALVDAGASYSYPVLFAWAFASVVIYGVVVLLLARLVPPLFAGGPLLGVAQPAAEAAS